MFHDKCLAREADLYADIRNLKRELEKLKPPRMLRITMRSGETRMWYGAEWWHSHTNFVLITEKSGNRVSIHVDSIVMIEDNNQ